MVPLMPYQLSLYCRRLCGTLSKALLKSMMIKSVCEGLLDRSVRLPHIACVFRRYNKPSVPSIMVSMMGDVNIVYINIDFLNEIFL